MRMCVCFTGTHQCVRMCVGVYTPTLSFSHTHTHSLSLTHTHTLSLTHTHTHRGYLFARIRMLYLGLDWHDFMGAQDDWNVRSSTVFGGLAILATVCVGVRNRIGVVGSLLGELCVCVSVCEGS
jgi:hypothetical protein